jgi:hypothetical protein
MDERGSRPEGPRITLEAPADVELAVFDVTGKLVKNVLRGSFAAGPHQAAWDGKDGAGRLSAPGLYFYRLALPDRVEQTKTLMLSR